MPAIGIVGSGSVAQALGRALRDRGAPVVAITGRNAERTARAARFIGHDVLPVDYGELIARAPRLIVAVADEAISHVARELAAAGMQGGSVLHTCGARGPEVLAALSECGVACGVLHPLQTMPSPESAVARLQGISFAIGGDERAVSWAEEIVRRLDGHVIRVSPDGFPAYHAAAALAGNAVAALLDSATVLMERAGVDRRTALAALAPLCRASVENVLALGPQAALTGPVARGDAATIRVHLEALATAPEEVMGLYRAATRGLVQIARRRGLAEPAAQRIDALLNAADAGRT